MWASFILTINMVENKENWERLNLNELFWLMFLPNVNITLRFSFFSNSLEKVFKLSFFGHILAFYKSVFNLIIRLWAISASTQVLDLWENIWVRWPFNIQFATLRHHTAADGRHFIDNTDKSCFSNFIVAIYCYGCIEIEPLILIIKCCNIIFLIITWDH